MNKPIPYNGISVVQNFICTIPERLELIKTNTPVVGKVWSDYEFFVNYNRETNFDEVHTIYKNSIPKLNFYKNLERDWALVTLALVEQVKTSHVIFINEDQEFFMTKTDWDNIINEAIIENGVDYILMNKVDKYNQEVYADGKLANPDDPSSRIIANMWGMYPSPGYTEGEHVYFYQGKYAPHKRVSNEAVYRTEWFKELLIEFIENGDACTHDIPLRQKHIANFYEGYWDHANSIQMRFPNLKCAMAKANITRQWNIIKQNRV